MANKPTPADFSPTVPDFPVIGQYQPVYGKFDLTTYIQGASDYEIMSFLVQCYNATLKGYSHVTQLSKDTVAAYNQLQTWVNTWFDNLDVQQEINNKLQAMYEAGTLATAIAQSNSIPPAVAQYLNSAEGTKNLSDVTAQKIEAMAASGSLGTVINNTGTVQSTTTNWLQQNVTPTGSAVMVDKSLSIEGAAADSKITGGMCFNKLTPTLEDNTDLNDFTVYGSSFLSSARTYINAPTTAGILLNYNLSTNQNIRKLQVVYDFNPGSNAIFARRYNVATATWTDWRDVVTTDKTLSVLGMPADAKTTGGMCFNKLTNVVNDNTDLNDFTVYGSSFLSSARTYINAPTIAGILLNYNLSTNQDIRKLQVVYDFKPDSNAIFVRRYNVVTKAWTNWENVNKKHDDNSFSVDKLSDDEYNINCNGYEINFKHVVNTSSNSDLWNIISIKKGSNIVVPRGTDILGPIKETNGSNFSGGVHGNEHVNDIYIDYNDASFSVVMNSAIYSTIDSSVIFDRTIQLYITNNEITIDSVYTAKKNCSVERCTNGGLIASYVKDTKAVCCANAFGTPDKSSNAIKENTTATFITNYGTIVCENIIGHELDSYKGFLIVYSNEAVPRYKIYFDTIEGKKALTSGEVIHGKFRYKLL